MSTVKISLSSPRKSVEIAKNLRTDFPESESGRFSGIVTIVLRLSSDEPQVI